MDKTKKNNIVAVIIIVCSLAFIFLRANMGGENNNTEIAKNNHFIQQCYNVAEDDLKRNMKHPDVTEIVKKEITFNEKENIYIVSFEVRAKTYGGDYKYDDALILLEKKDNTPHITDALYSRKSNKAVFREFEELKQKLNNIKKQKNL